MKIIAEHNLCIAYSRLGNETQALEHCTNAAKFEIADVSLKHVSKNIYKIIKKRSVEQKGIFLSETIAQNLKLNAQLNNTAQIALNY